MFQGLSFRSRLLLVLFVPFLALIAVSGAGLSDRFSDLHAQEQFGGIRGSLDSLGQLSTALEHEAVASSWFVTSRGADDAGTALSTAQHGTTTALDRFNAQRGELLLGASPATQQIVAALGPIFDQLDVQRDRVRRLDALATSAGAFFLDLDDRVVGAGERVVRDLRDPEAAAGMLRAFSLRRENYELAKEASIFIAVSGSGTGNDFAQWISAIAAETRATRLRQHCDRG